ncbi:C2H2 and C2HC zinc finger [Glarea lozoyensis ATCC 20868]|uniref:C2H2 and C2HC zinc finger n=1 Tax=Glarea lozoyensis (strain ATCC 20868 / MF5171) TaxID=1116229 RepID=S3DE64_GLAL2|nr:C2H2 and C2HC zinc finger [Glarea lozoyensis ATCC 20868]EPE36707.1 C2H2 and C2HC zinc finger [Glarea lozoyensis ATCC 20868]
MSEQERPEQTRQNISSKHTHGITKRYICKYEGCTKSFSRSDHLKRHNLNHTTGKSTCPRCSVHFYRQDLLDRHLARHKQRDDEAGGYGLGVVETRKRLWRDAEGNLVSKRPTLPENNPSSSSMQEYVPSDQPFLEIPYHATDLMNQYSEPISPPVSSSSSLRQQQQGHPPVNHVSNYWHPEVTGPLDGNESTELYDFLANSSWGSQSLVSAPGVDDNIFNPDTASSFNMPFTTMNNYSWLFDVDILENDTTFPMGTSVSQSQRPAASTSNHLEHSRTSRQSELLCTNDTATIYIRSNATPNRESSAPASTVTSLEPQLETMQKGPVIRSSIFTPSRPLQTFGYVRNVKSLPIIDEVTRYHLLDLIVQASPKTPEGILITRQHPLLSLPALQNYCDLFFCRFNLTYPLIHQATFEPSQVEPLLLVSILLLGATYGDKSGHGLAVCIHDVLRAQIFQNTAFTAQPDLWILQTILLVECFGKSRAGQTQHDMSHLFHGLLINLIRRSNCQTAQHRSVQDVSEDKETHWKYFVDVEHRKRLALLCFLWDTQHAVLFSQSLCMSAFELRLSLPCSPASWEADSAEKWYNSFKNETEIYFLPVLKGYVNLSSATASTHLNALSRLLILHGLMSISWDMKRREQTSLGFAGSTALDRQTRLADSYDMWKAEFDNYCMTMTIQLKDDTARKKEFVQFSTSSIAIFHAAHITLDVEILDLQIYAGARHIIGRPVTRTDYDRSRQILKQWVKPGKSRAAVNASWHAAYLLRDGIMNLDNWDVNDAFHYPWCLYLATLTCWAFHAATNDLNDAKRSVTSTGAQNDDLWDAQTEMNTLVSGMTSGTPESLRKMAGKYATSGLTAMMGKHLATIQWAVVHEGMKVLRGLAADRRSNE